MSFFFSKIYYRLIKKKKNLFKRIFIISNSKKVS